MNRKVTLLAGGINVTAASQDRAISYLREDAWEFRRNWNYGDAGVETTDEDPTDEASDAELDVEVDISKGRGERVWTGDARFTVIVAEEDDVAAYAAARSLLAA